MSENPSVTIEFKPDTFEILSIQFQAVNKQDLDKLEVILSRGVKCEATLVVK